MAGKKNYNKISTEAKTEEPIVDVVEDVEVVEETVPESVPQIGVVCNCQKLNVRKKPDTDAKVACIINADEEVEIIDDSNKDFYEVKANKVKGFCMKKYIKIK